MKLKELLKIYYRSDKDVTMGSSNIINRAFKELILPGAFSDFKDYRKTLSWNMDRDAFYRIAAKDNGSEDLHVTITTGKMDFFFIFEDDSEFQELLEAGLKKHRSYRKEFLSWDMNRKFLFYSKKYE